MDFEKSYEEIVRGFSADSERDAITFSDDLKSFLSKNISNMSFSCYNKNGDLFLYYTPSDGQLNNQKYNYCLYYSRGSISFELKKKEKMSDIVNRRDFHMRFDISANEYGETRIIKGCVNENGEFREYYHIDERKILTKIYDINDASELYNKYDKELGPEYTYDMRTTIFGIERVMEPKLQIEARVRGKFFVIDAGDEHDVIPREDNMTLYSVYYDYMVRKGYYFADDKPKNIKR